MGNTLFYYLVFVKTLKIKNVNAYTAHHDCHLIFSHHCLHCNMSFLNFTLLHLFDIAYQSKGFALTLAENVADSW